MLTRMSILTAAMVVLSTVALAKEPAAEMRSGEYVISGPHVHENLSVFLIHGADRLKGRSFLTLQEALEQGKVIVHETGNVSELAIENVSDEEVYIQSGDIVKGGRQDRTIAQDFLVTGKSGRVPIASFCVESGRWSGRGEEAADRFSGSDNVLASRELKLAARKEGDQGKVWAEVATAQARLSESLGADVAAPQSGTSLQLTLENEALQETTEAYLEALRGAVEEREDVIGYAFAINGRMNSAEVYGSAELFGKLWPKLLRASVVEAIGHRNGESGEAASVEAVVARLEDAGSGERSEKRVSDRVQMVTQETDGVVLFETVDGENGSWVHRSYIVKD